MDNALFGARWSSRCDLGRTGKLTVFAPLWTAFSSRHNVSSILLRDERCWKGILGEIAQVADGIRLLSRVIRPRAPRNHSKTYKVPRRPFEAARLDAELKLAGEYGLRNKREIWRIALILSKIRRAARELLKLDEKDPKRLFEGNAIIRRLVRIGVLDETRMR